VPEVVEPPPVQANLHILQVAWRHKSLIALGIVLGLTLGLLYYAQRPPLYQSTAQVLVVKKRPEAVTGVVAQPISVEDYVATQQVLIKSPVIVDRAIKKGGLANFQSFANEKEELTEVIIKALTVTRNKTTAGNNNVLDLSFRGAVASECGPVLRAIIESYKDFLDETYRNLSDDTLALVTRARNVLQKDLAQKEEAYRQFRQKTPLLWKGRDSTTLRQDRLVEIEAKRSALVLRRTELEGQLAAIESALKSGQSRDVVLAIVSEFSSKAEADDSRKNSASDAQDKLLSLLIEEQNLLQRYGSSHPEVQGVRRRIDMARDFLSRPGTISAKATSRSAPLNGQASGDPVDLHLQYLRQKLEQVRISEKLMAELYQREDEEARKLTTHEIQDEALRTDIAQTQKLYDGLIKRLQDVGLVKDVGGYDARAIAPPTPGRKVAPNPLLVFPSAALLGLLAGLGLAYLAEAGDKSFRTPDEIRRRLGLPIVGHIPFLKSRNGSLQSADGKKAVLDPLLYAFHRPRSGEAEAFRGLRTALYFSTRGEGHKVIQITSPDSSDGKTTLAANLAVSIAQSGAKTLLIDADFRKPQQHKIFGLPSSVGLSGALGGTAEVTDAIQQSAVPGLCVLPCGAVPPNPAELLTAPRFKELLDLLRDRYDFVLIDTPPILAVTDPCVVAPRVDGVLLVIRPSKHGRPHAERTREILGTLGATVLGVVVNGVDSTGHPTRYGYGHYGYGAPYGEATSDGATTSAETATQLP
jgi:capsular exopolysaccharide synthesis family protein